MKTILIGEAIALFIILLMGWRLAHGKETKRNTDNKNKTPNDISSGEYDSTGRRMSTEFEMLVERDPVEIQKIHNQTNDQKKLELQRKGRSKKKSGRYCKKFS